MRKILGIILAVLLLCSSAFAEGPDYSSLSTTELQDIITATRNELLRRTALNDGKLFIVDEPDGVQIYLTGKCEENWMGEYDLEVIVINNSSQAISISFDEIVVNGWETETALASIHDIGAEKKKKDAIPIAADETDITTIQDVQELEISFRIYDSSTYETLHRYGPIIIYYDGVNWYNSPQ